MGFRRTSRIWYGEHTNATRLCKSAFCENVFSLTESINHIITPLLFKDTQTYILVSMLRPFNLMLFALFAIAAGAEEPIDFNKDIRPILSAKCFACHGPDEAERGGNLRLDTQEGSRKDLGGYAAVAPGDVTDSELIYRVLTEDENDLMPPSNKGTPMTKEEVALLKIWIEQGGEYATHWAYEKPVRPAIPDKSDTGWPTRNPIDHFIQRHLKNKELGPSAAASRYTIARRVALDLTGVPPTWEEVRDFVQDHRRNAYEHFVDSQLAKPTHGERWAAMWLDLARYADSAGYANDPDRSIWSYRDWVIDAFNQNQPFDQFTIDQIAGDLLENPTSEQLVATAFHRNTPTNSEGGTNDEEFRNVAVVDRVNTTFEVWMATTMACAQCHTHKYDPITHHEYFQIFDYFNQTTDNDQKDESPLHEIWTDDQLETRQSLTQQIDSLAETLEAETQELARARQAWLKTFHQPPTWEPLVLNRSEANNTILLRDPNHPDRIIQQGDRPETSHYTVQFPGKGRKVTGLQLKVHKEQATNFVLSKINASWTPSSPTPIEGRFVRVSLEGNKKMIHLAEVEIFSNGSNIASEGVASQNSTGFGGPAGLAIDGDTNGFYQNGSVSHTAVGKDPWFEVDLKSIRPIDSIAIWNRMDKGTENRLQGYHITVLDEGRNVVWEKSPEDFPKPSTIFSLKGARPLEFRAAFADYEQNGFPAKSVIDEPVDPKKGWAIGGGLNQPHELTLVLNTPLTLGDGNLKIELLQESEHKRHILTHFSLATSDNGHLEDWAGIPENIRTLILKPRRSANEEKELTSYHRTIAKELAVERNQLAKLKKEINAMKPVTVPIMQDLSTDQERESFIHIRGNYKNSGDQVHRGTPAVFHPVDESLPANRLQLAHWLVDSENPLTARVVVNRFWEQIFGTGIVATSEEFGSQGDQPTHPELLDWLAIEFQESGWDVKALLKLMVTSATYRQVSELTPELEEKDPFNRFYARAPRFRIPAEMIRDQALFVSGLISDKMHGEPVNPPQPDLGLKAAFGAKTDWVTSQGEDRYRRGIYTSWRRSSPYPSMSTFDAPNREICTSRRIRTNTPLQALVTLNDPVYVEAAQALARQSIEHGGDTVEGQIVHAMQTALLRYPKNDEVERLTKLYKQSSVEFSKQPEAAETFATNPIGPLPEGANATELAALTLVGNVILNLDEIFLKR